MSSGLLNALLVVSLTTSTSSFASPITFATSGDNILFEPSRYAAKQNQYHRREWEDMSLPVPISTHDLHQHNHRTLGELEQTRSKHNRRALKLGSELTPLYPGYGTHFSYVWIGSPPQRQSVIVDTGSHYTAFPCTGCQNCGQHTDSYWDPKNSSTAKVPLCNNKVCEWSQSYSEGSSWKAYKVQDKMWVGGLGETLVPQASSYAVNFEFGCQTSETGLFRTQLADGIMGMSIADDTLPQQLKKQKISDTSIFAMCFRVGGGIMTIGGVDQRIHSKPDIYYAKLLHPTGWFTINVLEISLQDQKGTKTIALKEDSNKYNSGKGSIVDSGTTDTYLPSSIADSFNKKFKSLSGVSFTSANIALSKSDLDAMPNIIFTIEGTDGKPFDIVMPWTNYVDNVGGGKYAFRIYLTEGAGAVLGANFMNGQNVIFDADNLRVGFSKSFCKYEDFASPETSPPTVKPTHRPTKAPKPKKDPAAPPTVEDPSTSDPPQSPLPPEPAEGACVSELVPLDACTARCDKTATQAYIAEGTQDWADKCGKPMAGAGPRPCHQSCTSNKIVRGNPFCRESPWTECGKACIQSRTLPKEMVLGPSSVINGTAGMTAANCGQNTQQTRVCYTGSCPTQQGDYLIFIDMRIRMQPSQWSYVHSEAFYAAFAYMFNVKESAMELLNDAGNEYTLGTKLHFQLRLKSKDYASVQLLHKAAQSIPEKVWSLDFPRQIIVALDTVSKKMDYLDYSRFGWLLPADIEILNAMALPMGDVRDPVEVPVDPNGATVEVKTGMSEVEKIDLIVAGVAVASILILLCMCYFHWKLRQEHFALAKDKAAGSLFKIVRGIAGSSDTKGLYTKVQQGDSSEGVDETGMEMGTVIRDDVLEKSDFE